MTTPDKGNWVDVPDTGPAAAAPTKAAAPAAPDAPATPAAKSPVAGSAWTDVDDTTGSGSAAKPEEAPGGGLWAATKGYIHGLGDILYGGAELGSVAPEIGAAGWDTGQTEELHKTVVGATKQREEDWRKDPTRKAHPFQAGAARWAGDLSGVLAETGPLAALAPETAAGSALIGGGTGYLGALTEPIYADPENYASAKIGQTALGTAEGAVLGPLFHGIASGLKWWKGYRAGSPEEKAQQIVSEGVREKTAGGGPSATDVINQMADAKANGQPYAMLDVLPELGGSVYRSGGAARQTIKGFQEGRTTNFADETELDAALQRTQQGKRLVDRMAQSFGNASARLTAKVLSLQRSEHARPLWDKAMNHAPVWSPRLQQFLDLPEVKSGLGMAWKQERLKAAEEGRQLNPLDYAIVDFNEAGDPIFGKVPNMRMLQLAKEGLDAQWEANAKRDGFGRLIPNKLLTRINGARKAFVNELDNLNGDYKAARQQWSGDTETMEALEDGRNALDRGFSPEEFAERWNSMTPGDREFFKLGIADRMKSDLDNWRTAGDESKALIRTSAVRQKLRTMFDSKEDFDSFVNFVEREREIYETGTKVMKNSPTAERSQEDYRNMRRKIGLAGAAFHTATHPLSPRGYYELAQRWGEFRHRAADPALDQALAGYLTDTDVPLSPGYGPGDLNVGAAGRQPQPPVTGAPSWLGGIAPYIFQGY